ncbi:unnamed protein product [Cylindrotheca closterium]|uniref:PAS domain-containing protein n=1 Tax=Cylindrotheca closterium TaxID=2856 RepID=A0AAD2CFM5_9STRA|nr:unnamed protein product [Cylindrotheca closterium]
MHMNTFQVQDTHFASGNRSEHDRFDSAMFEQPSMVSLEFPSLASEAIINNKRCAYHRNAPVFPPKRRKTVSPLPEVKEDNSWIDNFSLLDSFSPEDSYNPSIVPECPTNHHLQQEQTSSVTEIIKQALTLSSEDFMHDAPQVPIIPSTTTQDFANHNSNSSSSSSNNGYLHDSQLPTGMMSQQTTIMPRLHVRTISETQMAEMNASTNPSAVSLRGAASPVALPRPIPSVDPSEFTISKLKHSKEPTLLTLTSYPYRVVYSNEAFSKMSGSKTSVIGDSVFDTFKVEGTRLHPSLATYPTLVGRLDNEVALVPSFTDDQDNQYSLRCGIQAFPVTKRNDSNALRYYAIRFSPLQFPH